MNELIPFESPAPPRLIVNSGGQAGMRFLEFFAASIRNPNTRRAYHFATTEFFAWYEQQNLDSLIDVQSLQICTGVSPSGPGCRLR